MSQKRRRRLRKIAVGLLLYLILWGFFWCFLLVETRSYNRLTHEPVTMAQLTIQNNSVTLRLAEHASTWYYPDDMESVYFWIATLPSASIDWAITTWQLLRNNCH